MDYDGPLDSVRLMPGANQYSPSKFNLSDVPLPQKYPTPLLLKNGKIKDLYALLSCMPPQHTNFFNELLRVQREIRRDGGAAAREDEEESDIDNGLLDYDA